MSPDRSSQGANATKPRSRSGLGLPSVASEQNGREEITRDLELGNRAYDEEEFETAITAYQRAVKAGFVSPDIFLLLGNAHFRTDSKGEAILWWRRAQVTSPRHPEATQNLRFVDPIRNIVVRNTCRFMICTESLD